MTKRLCAHTILRLLFATSIECYAAFLHSRCLHPILRSAPNCPKLRTDHCPWVKGMPKSDLHRRAADRGKILHMGSLDDHDKAELLPLSDSDLARLEELRSRRETMPIMILDAMLPRQRLHFGSEDPKFRKLIDYALEDDGGEIGMIGINPYTGKPLSVGTTLTVSEQNVGIDSGSGMLSISAQGLRRFEVQGEPWMDESKSFYLADVEIVDDRVEPMSAEQERDAEALSSVIPELIETWLSWVIETGKSDKEGMKKRMDDIGPMPDAVGERAIWVASLINPLPALGVCLEIRPAMLACKNDLDRVKLATAAIQSSIDHLSGKRPLF